jgi:hypothetical protein
MMALRAFAVTTASIVVAVALACLPLRAASAQRLPAPTDVSRTGLAADQDFDALEALCLMIESAAKANDLPPEFFARVIWQEGHFQVDTGSPEHAVTGTRRLLDPFDPVQALPKAAEFLAALRLQFGNLGLAAAAYHLGPERVQAWLAGTGAMPPETRNYVIALTGTSVDDWVRAGKGARLREAAALQSCHEVIALFKTAPNPFVFELEQRIRLSVAKPWGVQLAAGFDREQALTIYAREMRRLRPAIGDQDTTLLAGIFRSRGTRTFYQVRIGANTRPAADALCDRIRLAGGACFVLRTRGMAGGLS